VCLRIDIVSRKQDGSITLVFPNEL